MTRLTRTTSDGTLIINGHKIAAILAQLGSFATTYAFIYALGLTGYTGFFFAVGTEFLLAAGKALVFNSRKASADALGWIAIIVDMFLNAGGIWPYAQHLDNTPVWVMLTQSMGLEGELRKLPALIITLALGYALSIAPHRFWRGA
jgi:hypothetical protein